MYSVYGTLHSVHPVLSVRAQASGGPRRASVYQNCFLITRKKRGRKKKQKNRNKNKRNVKYKRAGRPSKVAERVSERAVRAAGVSRDNL